MQLHLCHLAHRGPVAVGVLKLAGEDGQGGGRTFSPMCTAACSD